MNTGWLLLKEANQVQAGFADRTDIHKQNLADWRTGLYMEKSAKKPTCLNGSTVPSTQANHLAGSCKPLKWFDRRRADSLQRL